MRKQVLTILFGIWAITAWSQTITITSSLGQDTIQACQNQQITFYGYLINGTDTLDAYWKWDMDDGTVFQGQGLDTVRYSFIQDRGYRVFAYATYGDSVFIGEILVKVGLKPLFTGTTTDIPPGQIGICSGDQVMLTGKIQPQRTWTEQRVSQYIEPFAFQVTDQIRYFNSITRKDFAPDQRLVSGNDIDSVGILIVHPNSQEIKITLTSPAGDTIILKDYGGNPNFFGEPAQGQNGAAWYYWNLSASTTINALGINGQQIPPGAYLPDQSFDNLAGTLLNGQWTITVTDSAPGNDGYVLGWAIFFNPAIASDTFEYTNTYDLYQAFWNGDNVNLTSNGVATAYPEGYGDHLYKFYVTDNFGCSHDTTVRVNVEQPDFSIDKRTVIIADSILVEDLTTWATEHQWNFGDQSPVETGEQAYHKYFEKGQYLITLTAISATGCSDEDTAWVTVVPKPIELADYNVFTPNGDGVNDVFSFFTKPDEKITAYNIEKIDGRIYNRDGQVVCRWTTPEEAIRGWDGTINNNGKIPASEGVYYYIIIIKGKDGKDYPPFTGYIYLHR